ncbi:hypothetical protein HY627_00305 [Candidatus Uhrbacteria bacterium]|nr:hypothetical protein [Candidatus Uhrbacteria bacterium]
MATPDALNSRRFDARIDAEQRTKKTSERLHRAEEAETEVTKNLLTVFSYLESQPYGRRVDLRAFKEIFPEKRLEIEADELKVLAREKEIERSRKESGDSKERQIFARVAELIVAHCIHDKGCLGDGVHVFPTSRHDDLERGSDIMAELINPQTGKVIALALDVTLARDPSGVHISEKEDRAKKSIAEGGATVLKYQIGTASREFPDGSVMREEALFTNRRAAHVTIDISPQTVRDFCDAYVPLLKRKEELEEKLRRCEKDMARGEEYERLFKNTKLAYEHTLSRAEQFLDGRNLREKFIAVVASRLETQYQYARELLIKRQQDTRTTIEDEYPELCAARDYFLNIQPLAPRASERKAA